LKNTLHITLQNEIFAVLAYCYAMLKHTKCKKTAVEFRIAS